MFRIGGAKRSVEVCKDEGITVSRNWRDERNYWYIEGSFNIDIYLDQG